MKKNNTEPNRIQKGKRQMRLVIFFAVILISVGIGCLLYPLISNYLYEQQQDTIITEYEEAVSETDAENLEEFLEAAQEYNEALAAYAGAVLTDPFDFDAYGEIFDEEAYESLLNVNGDGIMGYLTIPSIDVYLPIFHGTSDAVLSSGVGHLENSSLPVGGESTHAVLSSHTGLSSRRLFTDLVELEEGDCFYITVLGETLAYVVDQITVVEPDDTSLLGIYEGKDYVTLLTCTPYGVNDHRLLVRGTRTEYVEDSEELEEDVDDETDSLWWDQYKKSLITGVCAAGGTVAVLGIIYRIVVHVQHRRKRLKR